MKSICSLLCRHRLVSAVLAGIGVGWAMAVSINLGVGIAIGGGMTLIMAQSLGRD